MNPVVHMSRTMPRYAFRPLSGWFALLAFAAWSAVFAALTLRPAAALEEARGLYAQEVGAHTFNWTSSRVLIPLHGRGGPVGVTLGLAAGSWPNRPAPQATLRANDQVLTSFQPEDRPRRYHLLLAPSTKALALEA